MTTDVLIRRAALPAFLCALSCASARAQSLPPDPVTVAPLQAGPVSLNPRLEILNVGTDSNVFNEEEGAKEDFTATVRPSLDAGLRLGRARFTARSRVDLIYFHEFEDERSVNPSFEGRAELRLARFVPYVTVAGVVARERPNSEIDLRARRSARSFGAGGTLLLLSRTALVVDLQRHTVEYDPGQQFGGEDLARQLNSTRETMEGGIRLALTPLTTMSVTAGQESVRFDASPHRDARSVKVMNRFEFDPTAIITGSAAVGYRRFTPEAGVLRAYRGVVAQVDVRCTLRSRTRVDTRFARDVEYSFDEAQPYYVTTGGTFTVTQQIGGPFDLQAVGGRERLRYQRLMDAPVGAGGIDTTSVIGGGVGYRLGDTARLGVNVDFTDRESHRPGHSYERRRVFGSLTYRF